RPFFLCHNVSPPVKSCGAASTLWKRKCIRSICLSICQCPQNQWSYLSFRSISSSHFSVESSTVLWSIIGRKASRGSYGWGQVWERTVSTCHSQASSVWTTLSLISWEGCSSGHQPYPP